MTTELNKIVTSILEGDEKAVASYAKSERALHLIDLQGYTPPEVAQFLGKSTLVTLMGKNRGAEEIRVKKKGEEEVKNLSRKEFAELFGVQYASGLVFSSYEEMQTVIALCPWFIRKSSLGEENRRLGKLHAEKIRLGYMKKISIRWIDERVHFGLFTEEDLEEGAFVGEYAGLVRPFRYFPSNGNPYCLHYPTGFFSWKGYVIDAEKKGNEMRFVNHSDTPNLEPQCLYDRGLVHFVLFAKKAIPCGAQLTVDYGKAFWKKRHKLRAD